MEAQRGNDDEIAAGRAGMAGYTPGPWRIDPNAWGDVQTADGRLEICTIDAAGYSTHSFPCPAGPEAAANARLIAAAPDVAAALRACLMRLEEIDDIETPTAQAARDALRKAGV